MVLSKISTNQHLLEENPFQEGRFPHMLEVYALYMADDQTNDLDEFEAGLLTWLVESDFHIEPWSTSKAAKAFKVEEDIIYEAVASLSRKVPNRIQIFYKNGALHIAAD